MEVSNFKYTLTSQLSDGWLTCSQDAFIERGLPAKECALDLSLLFPAGTETTVMGIVGTLLLVTSSPVVYKRIKQEIKEGIAAGRISNPVTSEEAKSLEYTQAAAREGLRMMGPLVFGFPKRVPTEGDTICGVSIPGGTDVYMNFYCMMHRKDVFGDDPKIFRPERFLGDGPNTVRMVKALDQVFGGGRFACLGKGLAVMEQDKIFIEVRNSSPRPRNALLLLAHHYDSLTLFSQLLRNFDFQVATPEKPWERTSNMSWMVDNFWMRVTEDTTMGDFKGLQ